MLGSKKDECYAKCSAFFGNAEQNEMGGKVSGGRGAWPTAAGVRLLQGHRSALVTNPARNGLRSTYRSTESTAFPPSIQPACRFAAVSLADCTGKLLNRPW